MTDPGVPRSPGFPLLDPGAQQAIMAARHRVEEMTRGRFPFPVKQLTGEEKEEARKASREGAVCRYCGAFHAGINTPACPRIATFKLNGDGMITEGSFWPDAATETIVEIDAKGEVCKASQVERQGWNTSRVVFAEAAEEEEGSEKEGAAGGAHPG